MPLVQSCPKFAGCAGSPRTPVMRAPSCSMIDAAAHAAVAAGRAGFAPSPVNPASSVAPCPSSTVPAKRRAQPSSGATASPPASSMVQLCSGQATRSPKTMPCDSGPPLCGQRSAARTRDRRRSGTPRRCRPDVRGAPPRARRARGMSVSAQTRVTRAATRTTSAP